MTMPDDDFLDAGCTPDSPRREESTDEDIDALVLFAGTQFDDPAAVEAKAAEWRALFPEGHA